MYEVTKYVCGGGIDTEEDYREFENYEDMIDFICEDNNSFKFLIDGEEPSNSELDELLKIIKKKGWR